MRLERRHIYTALAFVVVAVASLLFGMRLSRPAGDSMPGTAVANAALQQALEAYRADHGWYPGDPDRDWNSDGSPDVLRRQLTGFTRDDGKPAEQRDAQFCFGPYLREIPAEPRSGSGAIVVDQDGARALARLRRDVAVAGARRGWYYEARTGNVVANGVPPARHAGF
jgi:hypothetical protein